MALLKEPEICKKIKKIVMMGGGFFEGGNITPAAEFNVYVDPESAYHVLKSNVPIVMMPLDLTHKVLATKNVIKQFRDMKTRTGSVTANLLDFFGRFDTEKYGSDGAPLHDPNVIAYLIRPSLYEGKLINVEVETKSELTLGMTVADWWEVTDKPKNVFFVKDTTSDQVLELIRGRIAKLP
jgi:purine nucleosidase